MPLLMVRNDITKMQADAIVNPANEELLEGSGTSMAIFEAAGEKLLRDACAEIGWCGLGKAVATEAFHLDAKYIIHAVVPRWDDGFGDAEPMLYNAYFNSLLLAAEKKCESIAFPLLSSGNMGFPKTHAIKIAMRAMQDFLLEHEMMIYLVLYDRNSVSVSQKILSDIAEYIDDNYVAEQEEAFDRLESLYEAEDRWDYPETRRRRRSREQVVPTRFQCTVPLAPKRSLENLVNNLDETFSQMLLRLIDERGLKDSEVYNKANVDRRHFSKIRNNVDYMPTKKTVIAFAIALELTKDETVDLMNRAGYAFSKSSKFDVIIEYFLENRMYNVFEINEVLFKFEQPLLGE